MGSFFHVLLITTIGTGFSKSFWPNLVTNEVSRVSAEAELGQPEMLIKITPLLILGYLFLLKPRKVTERTNRILIGVI